MLSLSAMRVVSSVVVVALMAVLCLVSIRGAAPAPTIDTYAFCYTLTGLNRSAPYTTLDDQYTIAVLVTGTYNTTLLTSDYNVTTGTVAGSYYNLLTATGNRTIRTRNTGSPTRWPLVVQQISGLDVSGDFSDNRFYIEPANATLTAGQQFVDGDGLSFYVTPKTMFPGKLYTSAYNVYRMGIHGGVDEDATSGIDYSRFNITASIANWTGDRYVPESCVPPVFTYTIASSIYPGNSNISITYFLNGTTLDLSPWNVTVIATFPSTHSLAQDVFGDIYFTLDSTKGLHMNGTRTYCINGTCKTSSIYRAAPINTFGVTDNRIYQYKPWLSINGPAYLIDPPLPVPGSPFTAIPADYANAVNPYISKTGPLFERFGTGFFVPPKLSLVVTFMYTA